MTRNFFNRYLDTALHLIAVYDGKEPLSHYLKNYFAHHKKHGSKDRKWIAHFCYCHYRLGFALRELNREERLRVAVFLCSEKREDWLSLFDEVWQAAYTENLDDRIRFIQSLYAFNVTAIFYNNDIVSSDIEVVKFNVSHLIQPDVFLRVRPEKKEAVIAKLQQQDISFKQITDSCLALESATKIDGIIDINKEAVIQDASSQQVASFFSLIDHLKPTTAWDCCAASGGKSILAYDYFIQIKLTVSDIRESIIRNLKERFKQADIKQYHSFIADVSSSQFSIKQQYDFVICDAPCSGSGTWSRTPEQLHFFTNEKLDHYIQLQKKITANAVKAVKPNGYFLYITCSVFRQENEELVTHIQSFDKLTLLKAEIIKGYDEKADTMFAALFIKREN